MRILQILPRLDTGGVEETTLEMAEILLRFGHEAYVISAGGEKLNQLKELGAKHYLLDVDKKNPFHIFSNISKIKKIVRDNNIDIIHARSRIPAISTYFAAKSLKKPLVTTYHGYYHQNDGSIIKSFYNSIMARGDYVIANSEFIAKTIMERHGNLKPNITTIIRGFDKSKFDRSQIDKSELLEFKRNMGYSDNDRIIIMPARLSPNKGQMAFIKAISKLKKADLERYNYLIVGDYSKKIQLKEKVEAQIKFHNLGDRVKLSGRYGVEFPLLLAISDAAVMVPLRAEAFGRVSVEAQAMGVPVIASSEGGYRETVIAYDGINIDKATGFGVDVKNISSFIGAISNFINLSDMDKEKMGENAHRHAFENYDIELMKQKTLELYEEIYDK